MERKFCGKCGKLTTACTCNAAHMTTDFASVKSPAEAANQAGSYFIERFDKIALTQGEVVVKQYHIGEFAKGIGPAGNGSASIIVTNKRVISKQDSESLGASCTSVEEITLDNVAGVKNYYSQGYTIWRLVIGALAALIALVSFSENFLVALIALGVAAYMFITCRKPSYLFSIYASSTNCAMEMGANLRGKLFNSQGNGIMFQYKPTKEAVTMMCEIGACIIDLKTKGDLAIAAWKKA